MNKVAPPSDSATQPTVAGPKPRPMQISLGVLILLMVVFAIMSAGLMYASRVEIVQDELNTLLGKKAIPTNGTTSGRLPHLVFILFTLTSPLLLAGLLSTAVGVYRVMGRRRS